MNRHDPRYDRYPDIDELRDHAGDEITIERSIDDFTLGKSQAFHLTHRANATDILEDGISPGNLSSGARHLAWSHGPKVTKGNDHINDTMKHAETILDEARAASDFGDPSLLPETDTAVSLWPTPELPKYLLSLHPDVDPLPSCMPEYVEDERIPYVGFVIDAESIEMGPYNGLPHTLKRRHMDEVAQMLSDGGSLDDLTDEAAQLPVEYWNHCVVSGSYELVNEEIRDYPLPEVIVESSEGNELTESTRVSPDHIDALIVPDWTDDFDNLAAPDDLPSSPAGNYAFFMTN